MEEPDLCGPCGDPECSSLHQHEHHLLLSPGSRVDSQWHGASGSRSSEEYCLCWVAALVILPRLGVQGRQPNLSSQACCCPIIIQQNRCLYGLNLHSTHVTYSTWPITPRGSPLCDEVGVGDTRGIRRVVEHFPWAYASLLGARQWWNIATSTLRVVFRNKWTMKYMLLSTVPQISETLNK